MWVACRSLAASNPSRLPRRAPTAWPFSKADWLSSFTAASSARSQSISANRLPITSDTREDQWGSASHARILLSSSSVGRSMCLLVFSLKFQNRPSEIDELFRAAVMERHGRLAIVKRPLTIVPYVGIKALIVLGVGLENDNGLSA